MLLHMDIVYRLYHIHSEISGSNFHGGVDGPLGRKVESKGKELIGL